MAIDRSGPAVQLHIGAEPRIATGRGVGIAGLCRRGGLEGRLEFVRTNAVAIV